MPNPKEAMPISSNLELKRHSFGLYVDENAWGKKVTQRLLAGLILAGYDEELGNNLNGRMESDLPAMDVNKDRVGHYEVLMESITLRAGEISVYEADGSAIVVHATVNFGDSDLIRHYFVPIKTPPLG